MPPYTIQPARRRVGEAPLPGVSQQVSATGAFGGDVAGAIQQAGRQVQELGADIQASEEKQTAADLKLAKERTKAAAELQERKDKAFAEQEFLSFQEKRIRYENDAFRAQRGDAVGLLGRTSEWLKKARDASISNLKNARAKELLNEMLNPEHTKTIFKSGKREAEQFALWDVELKDALYANAVAEAGKPKSEPLDLVDLEVQAIDALKAKHKGFDAETKKRAVAIGMSAYHESVINGKLVGDLPFAKEYFNKNEQLILSKEREELRLAIRKEDTAQDSRNAVIFLREQFPDDLSKQIGAAEKDKSLSPEASKETIAQLRQRSKDDKAEKATENLVLNDQVTGQIDDILRDPARKNAGAYLAANNAPTEKDQRAQRSYIDTEIKKQNTDIETDDLKYTELQRDISSGKIKTLDEVRRKGSPISSKEDMKSLETLFNQGGRLGGLKEEQIVKQYKLFTRKNPSDNKTHANQYQFTRRYIENQVKALDRNLTQTDLNKWMSEALIQSKAEGEKRGGGFGYGEDITYGEAFAEGIDVARDWLPDITDDDKLAITPILEAEGIKPSEFNIRIYQKYEVLGIQLEEEE